MERGAKVFRNGRMREGGVAILWEGGGEVEEIE